MTVWKMKDGFYDKLLESPTASGAASGGYQCMNAAASSEKIK